MTNGSSADEARKRRKTELERSDEMVESPLDAEIRRMTQQLEELKKQRLIAELQEKILAEQQALEVTRQRLSLATAAASVSVSPQNSPAPVLASPTAPIPRQASSALQPVVKPALPATRSSPAVAASMTHVIATGASQPHSLAPVLQPPAPQAPAPVSVAPVQPAQNVNVKSGPVATTIARNNTSPSVVNGTSTAVPTKPANNLPAIPVRPQQPQNQLQWYERPRTPGAPNEAGRERIPLYGGGTRENYTGFISALETHFAKAPSYYDKEHEYRRVKLALEHVVPAERARWLAQTERPATWYGFRAFLVKDLVRQLKLAEQARVAKASAPAAPTPAAALAPSVPSTTGESSQTTFGMTQSSSKQQAQPPMAVIQPTVALQTQPAVVTEPVAATVSSAGTSAMMPPPAMKVQPVVNRKVAQSSSSQYGDQKQFDSALVKVEPAMGDTDPFRKPSARSEEAYSRYKNGQQRPDESVSSFSTWLQRLLPDIDQELSLEDRMGFLKRGVVSSVRNRAHRPFSYFKTYEDYVSYLQDIEDTLPQRQVELKRGSSPGIGGDSYRPDRFSDRSRLRSSSRGRSPARELMHHNSSSMRFLSQAPSAPGRESAVRPTYDRAASTAPTSTRRRGLSLEPEPPFVKPSNAQNFFTCREFIVDMENHFARHPHYYNDERKVALARRMVAPSLDADYRRFVDRRISEAPVTWFDFCVFMLNQAANSHKAPDAIQKYLRSTQRPQQSIRDFALWLQQYAPHYQKGDKDDRKHLIERAHASLRDRARRPYNSYPDFASYVAYLEQVEKCSPLTPKGIGLGNVLVPPPAKRKRED